MTTKYFRTAAGGYVGGFSGAEPPAGSIEVPFPPEDARQVWNGDDWDPLPSQPDAS